MEKIKKLIGEDVTVETIRKFVESNLKTQTKTQIFDLLKIIHHVHKLELDDVKFHLYLNDTHLVECDVYENDIRMFSYRSYLSEKTNNTYNLLYVQGPTGHTKLHLDWDPKNKQEEMEMKQMFLDLKYKGYMIFECKKTLGIFKRKGSELTEFDPKKNHWIAELIEGKVKNVKVQEVNDESETIMNDIEFIDPENEEIKPNRKYVATAPIAGG